MMNFRSVVSITLLPLLILQLSAIELTIDWDRYTHGSILPLSLKLETRAATTKPQSALLATHASGSYEQLVFVGDVMLGRHVEFLMDRIEMDYPFAGLDLLEEFGKNAAVIGNFESAMDPEHIPTPAFAMRFSVPQDHIDPLKRAGFTHVSLANNHSLDYGAVGYQNAVTILEKTGIKTFGHQRGATKNSVTYLQTDHGMVALIGLNATGGNFAETEARQLLMESSEYSQLQIVYIHWGIEYDTTHATAQREIATSLVEAGADLIVGHHPHVVQDIESIDGVPVLYSLGNYVFDQYFNVDVQEGLVAVVEFDSTSLVRLVPVSSQKSVSQPQLLSGDERAEFLYNLAKRSDPRHQNSIKHGQLALYTTVASSSKIAMMKR